MKTKLMALEALKSTVEQLVLWIDTGDVYMVCDRDHAAVQKGRESIFALEADIANPTAPAWIPVSERLPADDGKYLCATWTTITMRQVIEIVAYRSGSGQFDCVVTHWMPIPAAPGVKS